MIVTRYHTYVGPVQMLEKENRYDISGLTSAEIAVVVNALEEYALSSGATEDQIHIADDLVMQITRVTGY